MQALWPVAFVLYGGTWLPLLLCCCALGGVLCMTAQWLHLLSWLHVLAFVFLCFVLALLCCVLCVVFA